MGDLCLLEIPRKNIGTILSLGISKEIARRRRIRILDGK